MAQLGTRPTLPVTEKDGSSILGGTTGADYTLQYLTVETDPIFLTSPAGSITAQDVLNWDSAFGWGDPSGLYSPIAHNHSGVYEPVLGAPGVDGYVLSSTITGTRSWVEMTGGSTGIVYPSGTGIVTITAGTTWGGTISDNSSNWNTAYGWGSHNGLYSLLAHTHTGIYQPAGTYSSDIHSNITALNAVSGTNSGDNAVNSLYSGLVTFPGFGITHALAAYGDHTHSGVYQPAGTYSTDIHSNISALNSVSGTNTGDSAVNTLYSGLVTFPGFGSTHVLAAYGDHVHTGVYQPAGTYSTDIHANITALNAVSGTNTGDNATNTQYSSLVSFPGFGTTGTTAAYGNHSHSGVYEPALGNPASNEYVLSSTSLGVRSWIPVSGGGGTVTSVDMTVPTGLSVAGNPIATTGTLAVTFTAGYSIPTTTEQTNWGTAYTNRITTFTTTGSSGAATLSANALNIPNYTLSGLGGQASSTNLTSLAGLSYVSASFVKMTAAGTFSLDTNTYLTSLSGAVLTDQTSGQTVGTTGARLTKLWATDITVTNAITGSVTGNAGTVTNATLTTALTNNGGAGTLTWPAAGTTLTIPTGGGTLGSAAFTASTAYQASNTNLSSLAGLSYASASFVKMTGANLFTLDTNTYLTSVTAHNLLSSTHGDTLADTVARGDVLIGNSTPKWARLGKGANGTVLTSDGTDVSWQTPAAAGSNPGGILYLYNNYGGF